MEAESLQALWEAAQTYDPSRGASLVTHAVNLARRNFQYLYRQMWPGGQAQWNRRIDAARYAQAFDGNLDAPLELEGGERELSEDLESAAAPDDTEAMVLLRTEYERVLTACAATLTPKQQQRLLVWVETGCCGAASRELGISRGMVANSVYLALGKLRAELGVAG
jgi:DNA-directed RNA polymerase specialized sigma24 family protein